MTRSSVRGEEATSAAPAEATAARMRIGQVAELTALTPRTIRYYEEIGLLPAPTDHAKGRHRTYTDADVARLRELTRTRDLLGVSLDQLRTLVEAEEARAILRERFHATTDAAEQQRILTQARGHLTTQLELVRERATALAELEIDLRDRLGRVDARLADLA
jgi:DNA-binding transcriptional MerR regulator